MKKIMFLFLFVLSAPLFSLDYKEVTTQGNLHGISISPEDKNEQRLKELCIQLEKDYKKEISVLIHIYDNEDAAKYAGNENRLSAEKQKLHDIHFIAEYWRSAKYHKFTIMLDGVNGNKKTFDFETTSIKEFEKEVLEKSENTTNKANDASISNSKPHKPTIDEIIGITITILTFLTPIIIIILLVNWKRWRYKVWFEFLVAVFMGGLGIQKFREKRPVLGVFYFFTLGLFFIGWFVDCIRYLVAAILNKPILSRNIQTEEIMSSANCLVLNDNDELPIVNTQNIILQNEEVCHFYEQANYITVKNVIVGRKTSGGSHSTKFLGVRYSGGERYSQTIRENVSESTPGMFTITSKRIMFAGIKGSFIKNISNLNSVTPYNDALGLQFGKNHYLLQMNNAIYAHQIIMRLVNNRKKL